MAEPAIRMYGAPWCPDCRRAKQFLAEHRVRYEWTDIDKDPDAQQYVQRVNEGKQIIPTRAERRGVQGNAVDMGRGV